MAATNSSPPPSSPHPPRTRQDVRQIAAASRKDDRSVVAAYAGLASPETVASIAAVAPGLGFAPPPPKAR